MKKIITKVGSFILSMLLVISIIPISEIISFAESETDIWDGTRVDFVTPNENTYYINSAKEFAWFAAQVNAGNNFSGKTIELKVNIDLNNISWTPIGKNLTCAFSGTFNGKEKIISNLNVNYSIDSESIINAPFQAVGLFGVCVNANISRLYLNNSSVSITNTSGYSNAQSSIDGTSIFAGEICGYSKCSSFSAIYSESSNITATTGSEAGAVNCGGFVGLMSDDSTLAYCFKYSGKTTGTSQSLTQDAYTGGVVGRICNEGTVRQCCNYGTVYGGHTICAAFTGGIVGYSENSSTTLSTIKDCYNQGNVLHSGSWLENGSLGGIIGYSFSSVNRCYNSGSIVASTNTVGGDLFAGGISGNSNSNAVISNCVSLSPNISGGTSNYVVSANGIKENNIARTNISNLPNNDSNGQYSISTFINVSTYTDLGWNFSEIWEEVDNGYPILKKMTSSVEEEISEVNNAIEDLLIVFADGDSYNKVTKDVTLLSEVNGLSVTWESSNDEIVNSSTGKVNRTESDMQVRLVASISKSEDYCCTKKFVLCVIGTNSCEAIQSEEWGMDVDSARELLSMVRNCKFKDIAVDDQSVLVLTGNDTDEEHIQDTMTEIISFWEVPIDNAYLRTKVGDVIQLIKDGSDETINDLVGDISDGLVNYNTETQSGELNGKTIAKKLMAIPEAMFEIKINAIDAYNKIKSFGSIEFDTEDDIMIQAVDNCKKIGSFVDYTVNKANSISGDIPNPSKLGNIFGYVSNIIEGFKLYGAFNDAKQNAVKAYLKNYLDNRENFSSPDDEEFTLIMDAHVATSINTDIDNIESVAEALYQLNTKFCSGLDDEYKIIIACPVDVEVYDSNGLLVGRVIDNQVDESIYNSVKITLSGDNNDKKTIYIQGKENYSFKLIGNNTGTMNVSIVNGASDYQDLLSYNNITLEKDKNMILDISYDEINEADTPKIDTLIEGADYFASEVKSCDDSSKLYNFNAFECIEKFGTNVISDKGGLVSDGLIESGTLLSKLVESKFGYSFDGFYTDIECTNPYDSVYMPAESLSVYAKFIRNDNNLSISQQPISASYIADETAKALGIDFECVDGYEINIQWYKKDLSGANQNAVKLEGKTLKECVPETSYCGIFGYYAIISLVDDEDNIIASVKSNTAIININESNLVDSGNCGDNLMWSFYANNKLKLSGNGNMAEYNSVDSIPWSKYASSIETIIIPETVYSISSYAFSNCTSLKSIKIPDSIVSIGEYALSGCNQLEELIIPFVGSSSNANDTYDSVLGYIFGRCKTSETGVTQYYKLVDNSFSGYSYKIPNSLQSITISNATQIPFGAFYGCSDLQKINLNNGIQKINGYAFSGCSSIKELSLPNSVIEISEGILRNCTSIESLTLPFVGSSRTANNTYDAVFGYIFGRCDSSTGINQYYNLDGTSLSGYYYSIPASLKTVTISDADIIPFGAFNNCSNITNFSINDVTNIGRYAFSNCTGITDFSIPNSVTYIGENALEGCDNIISLQIPFIGSSREANGTYDSVLGYIFGRSSSGVVQYGIVSGTSLSGYYYAIPSSLTSITVTDATIIPIGAFSNCVNVTHIKLNEGITELSNYSLKSCTGLKEIRLPSTLESLSYKILYDCSDLEKVYFYSKNCVIDNYNETIPQTATVYAYSKSTAQSYANLFDRNFVSIDVEISSDTMKIDCSKKIIYGITPGMTNLFSYITISGEGTAEISSNRQAVTGMELKLKDITGSVTDTYTVVVFGDVNCDGWYDGTDSLIVNCIVNGMLTREQVGEAVWAAADCNHDGVIDINDVELLSRAGLILSKIEQNSTDVNMECNSNYSEYVNLIDQCISTSDNSKKEEKDEVSQTKMNVFDFIIKFFWLVIKYIGSFVLFA